MTGYESKKAMAQDKITDEQGRPMTYWGGKAQPAQEPAIGDIRALKHRIHELEGEVIGYKRILDAQPAQEPSYWLGYGLQAHTEKPFNDATPLYTAPPQRPWVGLTDEEIDAEANSILTSDPVQWWRRFARAVLAKSREKNNG